MILTHPLLLPSGLPPSVVSIHLEGEMQAGATITAQYKYVGGMEGVSHYGWYLHEVRVGWDTALFPLLCKSGLSGH